MTRICRISKEGIDGPVGRSAMRRAQSRQQGGIDRTPRNQKCTCCQSSRRAPSVREKGYRVTMTAPSNQEGDEMQWRDHWPAKMTPISKGL